MGKVASYDLNSAEIAPVLQGLVAGDRHSLARCLRWVDELPELGRQIAHWLHPHLGSAWLVGVTGNPGAGKSTLVDGIIACLRETGRTVATLAVDPSSPFSGGAILGDRIRMGRHTSDNGVFIRSLATRGSLGGLSRATFDSVRVLDAAGFDVILIETVGVGQDEVDVARLAQTTVVVTVPGLGDDVQAMKAGLLEIADVFVVNKADRDGAGQLERSLHELLSMVPEQAWEVPVRRCTATEGKGIPELLAALEQHREFLEGPVGRERASQRARDVFDRLLDAALVERGRDDLGEQLVRARALVEEGSDPYAMVMNLLAPGDSR